MASGTLSMPSRSPLNELNDLLTAYIAVHDDVFSRSFRRIIPIPRIFQPIDWCGHRQALAEISDGIEKNAAKIGALVADESASSIHDAGTACITYCEALNDAVTKLHAICSRMETKANGSSSYSAQQYRDDLADYRAAESLYCELGDVMNMAFSVLRPYFT